jgi:asparagine synthase (glutamine-hydrolysing)
LVGARHQGELYDALVAHWSDPGRVVLGGPGDSAGGAPDGQATLVDLSQQMMLTDMLTYLPDDILAKVDRASMAVSLESRAPFLNHHLVEFAWQLPLDLKIREGQGKWLLRQVLDRYVPRHLVERPKMGFAVPIHSWLRGPLRDWAEGLLEEGRLRREGYLDPAPIRRAWAEHLSGRRNLQYPLWNVLMFQAWLESERR